MTKFKAEYRRALEVNMRENNFWLSYLNGKFRNSEDPTSILTTDKRLEQVTEASVKPLPTNSSATPTISRRRWFPRNKRLRSYKKAPR